MKNLLLNKPLSKETFQQRFKNLTLEEYSLEAYDILSKAWKSLLNIRSMNQTRQKHTERIQDCIALLNLLVSAKNGALRCGEAEMVNSRHLFQLAEKAEELYIDQLKEIESVSEVMDDASAKGDHLVIEHHRYYIGKTEEGLTEEIEYIHPGDGFFIFDWNGNVDKQLPKSEDVIKCGPPIPLLDLQCQLKKAQKALENAQQYIFATEEYPIREAMESLARLGIPLNNTSYREIYIMLDLFGFVPKDIKNGHSKSTSRYVRENYIKQKFNRAIEKALR